MTQSLRMRLRRTVMLLLIALAASALPSLAQVNLSFGVEVAPPPLPAYAPPPLRPGFVWAPGYWGWEGDHHVWVEGHWMPARPGYYWVPDGWEHHLDERGSHWHYAPGRWMPEHEHWEHDRGYHRGYHEGR